MRLIDQCLTILAALAAVDCAAAERPPAATPATNQWWRNEVAVVTWANFENAADREWLPFVKEIGSRIADRGVFYGHYPEQMPPKHAPASFFHANGLKVTSFLSVEQWDSEPQAVTRLIDAMKVQLDDGCDGVHLDMFFNIRDYDRAVCQSMAAVAATRRMRDALHDYGRTHHGRAVMLAGNVWRLDDRFALEAARILDVAWIESWGQSDLELVRMARVARALDRGRKPVWYHFQPTTDAAERVKKLVNLPKALFASCLMEGAVFLCNYQYPVLITTRPDKQHEFPGERGVWQMVPINTRWKEAVLRYAKFARAHKELLLDAIPQAPVLVVFRAGDVAAANRLMDALLRLGVSFNVLVYGDDPFGPPTVDVLTGYTCVVTPSAGLEKLAGNTKIFVGTDTFLRASPREAAEFLKIEGAPQVIGRVFTKGNRVLLHLKQCGYSDQADELRCTPPVRVTLCAPKVTRGACVSPDREGRTTLKVARESGTTVSFTVPGIHYYSLVVLE
jgi:hypothetical protein